jgi:hypothetical protein
MGSTTSAAPTHPRLNTRPEPRPANEPRAELLTPTELALVTKFRRQAALREKDAGYWITLTVDIDHQGGGAVTIAGGDGKRPR